MLHRIRRWIHNYFGFSRREANGLIVLMVLTAILLLLPVITDLFIPKKEMAMIYEEEIVLDSLVAEIEQTKPASSLNKPTITYFKFNPNHASAEDLEQLGLPAWLAQRIVNYREAGGSFTVKKDLLKIYGFDERAYNKLAEYIDLPEEIEVPPAVEVDAREAITDRSPQIRFDINTADTAMLKQIYGIGPTLSERIVRFREALGGFVEPQQLGEVYGLKADALDNLLRSVFIAEGYEPKKINVNFSDPKALASHPYISFELARHLVDYRSLHGPYADYQALIDAGALPDSVSQRLQLYLSY